MKRRGKTARVVLDAESPDSAPSRRPAPVRALRGSSYIGTGQLIAPTVVEGVALSPTANAAHGHKGLQ